MCKPDEAPVELILRGKRIAQDEHGFLSITDMWQLAGSEDSKKPKNWRRLPTTKALVAALLSKGRFSPLWSNVPDGAPIYSKPGNRGGTFAHVILALAYAEYLDPQLGIEVREIALRFWAGDITLLDDFMKRREEQAIEDGDRVFAREKIREDNSRLQFGVLRSLGARSRAQYAAFHNAGYRGLYNGEDENAIHRRKKLESDQRILDHMSFAELAANMFRVSLTEGRLKNIPAANLDDACATHLRLGKRVRDLMQEEGTDMPEDMPTVDSIAKAKKRLRDYDKSKKKLK